MCSQARSTGRFSPDAEFFAAHGVEPDPARIDCCRRPWQAEDENDGTASR
jgi:hypothetical protein